MAKAKVAGLKAAWQSAVKDTNGYIGVSLHSPNLTGEGLRAIVSWVNKEGGFKCFKVGLTDSLNRHNYMVQHGMNEEEAHREALRQGDLWIEENKPILDSLNIPYQLVRWDYWREAYPDTIREYTNMFRRAFESDYVLRAAIRNDVANFYERRLKTPLSEVSPEAIQKSVDYLIEELAVYSKIYEEYPSTKMYPGKELDCFTVVRDGKVENVPTAMQDSKFIHLRIWGLDKPAETNEQELAEKRFGS